VDIPLLGTVAAGKPILAEENWDGTIKIPQTLIRGKGSPLRPPGPGGFHGKGGYYGRGSGGDRKKRNARDGEIIVALVEEAVTLKRFSKKATVYVYSQKILTIPPFIARMFASWAGYPALLGPTRKHPWERELIISSAGPKSANGRMLCRPSVKESPRVTGLCPKKPHSTWGKLPYRI